jgi:hypothetical protein
MTTENAEPVSIIEQSILKYISGISVRVSDNGTEEAVIDIDSVDGI